MNSEFKETLTPCGLICKECSLFLIPSDKRAANEVLKWFKKEGCILEVQSIEDIIKNGDYCEGCRSSREKLHWSPDCPILKCCLDIKNLENCSECEDFPCDEYREWIGNIKSHKKAYDRLKNI